MKRTIAKIFMQNVNVFQFNIKASAIGNS